MKNTIDILREKIDNVDRLIINLLAKRLVLVKEIGQYKKKSNLPILDRKRWKKVLVNRMKRGRDVKISPNLIKKIYRAIHSEALIIEKSA